MSPLDVPLPFPATKARGVAIGDQVRKRVGGYTGRLGRVEHVAASGASALVRWPHRRGGGATSVLENTADLAVVRKADA